jgi:hypothetical protein
MHDVSLRGRPEEGTFQRDNLSRLPYIVVVSSHQPDSGEKIVEQFSFLPSVESYRRLKAYLITNPAIQYHRCDHVSAKSSRSRAMKLDVGGAGKSRVVTVPF